MKTMVVFIATVSVLTLTVVFITSLHPLNLSHSAPQPSLVASTISPVQHQSKVYLPFIVNSPRTVGWYQLAANPQRTGYTPIRVEGPFRFRWIWNGPAGGDQAGIDPQRVFIVAQSIGTRYVAELFAEYVAATPPCGVALLSNLLGPTEITAIAA
jgi:hypothetical protein